MTVDANRFDAWTRALSGRLSRRRARRRGGAGLVGGVVGALGVRRGGAQEGSPGATPAAASEIGNRAFLFVQTFRDGTFAPKAGEDGVFTLTLNGGTGHTVYFSDRPERLVGTVPTQAFLDGLGFSADDPPNAALVAQTEAGEDVLVVELFDPVHDEAAGTLTYDVRVLAEDARIGLASLAARQEDGELAERFDAASLFIDACPRRQCWDAGSASCVSCQCFQQGVQGCPCTTGTEQPCVDPSMVCEPDNPGMPGGSGTCWYP